MVSSYQISKLRKAFNQSLYQESLRLTKNISDAEDLLQDTWIKIAINIEDSNPEKFKQWALRVMKNTFIDLKRKENRRVRTYSYQDLAVKDDPTDTHRAFIDKRSDIAGVDNNASLSALLSVLQQRLIAKHFDILRLAYVDDLTPSEIARTMGISVKIVYSTLQEARLAARNVLNQ